MQKIHRQIADDFISVRQDEPPIRGKFPKYERLDALRFAQGDHRIDVIRRNGEDHALLGFGDPDFGVGQAVVF